jgi:peptidoglycan-associated lipoprotein
MDAELTSFGLLQRTTTLHIGYTHEKNTADRRWLDKVHRASSISLTLISESIMKKIILLLSNIGLAILVSSCAPSSKRYEGPTYGGGGMYGDNLPNSDVLGDPYYSDNTADLPAADRPSIGALQNSNFSIFRNQTIYFEFDSTGIMSAERQKLDYVAQESIRSGYRLILAGHCDERGTLEYNRALGERRALAVREYLVEQGMNARNISTISYGEEKPAVVGKSEAAYAKNRRVEIGVVGR